MKLSKNIKKKPAVLIVAALIVAIAIIAAIIIKVADNRVEEVPERTPSQAIVIITPDGFLPEAIKIRPGDSIKWVNQDIQAHAIAANPHPSHDGARGLESEALAPEAEYVHVFEEAGTYNYHDEYMPERNGVIEVGEIVGE